MNCRDPYEIESISFESILVVESTITNEPNHQKVTLSKTYSLENNESPYVINANVWVENSSGIVYNFEHTNNGVYLSNDIFQATTNETYRLFITTSNGNQYQSTIKTLTPSSEITSVYAEEIVNDNGNLGIQVYINNTSVSGEASLFRYEYEETAKIITPETIVFDASLIEDLSTGEYEIVLTPREESLSTCYKTNKSTGILQASLNDIEENELEHFPVRFLPNNSPLLRERYSILVKQYVQSQEAYNFYEIINELGSLDNFLSQNQPGYVYGNISSINNPNEKVIGFFDVSSYSSLRIYFSYDDFSINRPEYFYSCDLETYDYEDATSLDGDPNERGLLRQKILAENYNYISHEGSVYTIVKPQCGDCSTFASNIRPDFWED
ncbi:DUF4249 domain-containing protein [Mangrovimonas spongiae]|nr:DUF4249 domain-containing protein [Mangrovimonas spongiae]